MFPIYTSDIESDGLAVPATADDACSRARGVGGGWWWIAEHSWQKLSNHKPQKLALVRCWIIMNNFKWTLSFPDVKCSRHSTPN